MKNWVGEDFLKQILAAKKPAHAYLFFGSENSQKEEKAKQFATSLLCLEKNGCGVCLSCKKIKSGNHPDFRVIHPDGEKIKISQIRNLKAEARYGPLEGDWKIFIIADSQSFTEEAGQSLLKILEEPEGEIIFILTAPNPSSILPTLASRCQWVPIQPSVQEHDSEKNSAWQTLLREMPEDFLKFAGNSFEIFEKASLLEDYQENREAIFKFLLSFFRDLMVIKSGWEDGILLEKFQRIEKEMADKLTFYDIQKKIDAAEEALNYLNHSGNFRLVIENLLYKIKT
jgi:DNA polymerase-3 subunit delta'